MSTAAAKPAAGAAGEDGEAPKKKGGIVRYAIIGLVLLGALGAGGWFLSPMLPAWARLSSGEAKPEVKEPPVKATTPVANLVVNLGRPETRRYLKIGIELGLTASKYAKEIEEHKPQITDLIISALATIPVEKLAEEEGRTELKEQILEKIHEELHLEAVRRVYFTEFVIQ